MNLRAVFVPQALVLVAVAAAAPSIRYFRLERGVVVQTNSGAVASQASGAGPKQTCATLDAGVFEHAAPGLADLRLYRDTTETPYVIREAMPVEQQQPGLRR